VTSFNDKQTDDSHTFRKIDRVTRLLSSLPNLILRHASIELYKLKYIHPISHTTPFFYPTNTLLPTIYTTTNQITTIMYISTPLA
jgi:hypothetical protein